MHERIRIMNSIFEKIETPVNYSCDVLVAGGGFAGISAALAAARQGAEVILLERGFMLGGLATAGLVTIYLPICDGMGNQVSFGIVEELFHLSIEHGADARYPTAWLDGGSFEERRDGRRFDVQFNPQFFAISAERALVEAGVRILYGASAVSVHETDSRIDAVMIESKSGREAISVSRSVVDATGDADICHLSSARTKVNTAGNTLAAWYYCANAEGLHNSLNALGAADAVSRPELALTNRTYTGLSATDLSDMTIDSHKVIEADILKKRSEDGTDSLIPITIATTPQVRMTRCLVGKYDAAVTDDHRYIEDSVGIFSNWRKRGPIYELSFSSLYGNEVKNLLAAGRCFSVTDEFWDITRVIPVCAVSGEAAGVAAAMSSDMSSIKVEQLQAKLRDAGVVIHINDLELR